MKSAVATPTPVTGQRWQINEGDHLAEDGIEASLTPGVVDDAAVAAFTNGWCWALAAQIERATSWPMVVLGASNGDWLHAGCRRNDGQIIDIEGIWSARQWQHRWEVSHQGWLANLGCAPGLEIRTPEPAERELMGWYCGSVETEALAVAALFIDPVVHGAGRSGWEIAA